MPTISGSTQAMELRAAKALAQLMGVATGYWNSQVFFAACKLRIFEELSNKPLTAGELAEKTKIHPEGCLRLLAALRQLGMVEPEKEFWKNSELGAYCTSKSPFPMNSLTFFGEPLYHMWEFLPDALREYSPRWEQALGISGEDVFAAAYADPMRLRAFCDLTTLLGTPLGQAIAQMFDFSPYQCILDVGGGSGAIAIQVGLKFPHLRGIIMDLPPVCKVAEEFIQTSGLAERFTTHAGDFFTGPFPSGIDVILLSSVLHDWGEANCRKILRNCFHALAPDGVLLISEWVMNDDGSGKRYAVFTSLNALVACETGAVERNEREYRSLIEDAGFRMEDLIRHAVMHDLLIARKPSAAPLVGGHR